MRGGLIGVHALAWAMASGAMSADKYPRGVAEITYRSSVDQTEQPALWWAPPRDEEAVPLLVALHTWSGNYRQSGSQIPLAHWCQQQKWAFIHPNFRGPNRTPQAMGSDLAVADIASAVEFAKQTCSVDENRIYCVGVSGGGHASLLMAARTPKIWAGVSAWCGISDIAAWHRECRGGRFEKYARDIEAALGGGAPDTGSQRAEEALLRSPVHWLAKNRDHLPPLDIWHGIHDGRDGSVPFSHSLHAWNAAAPDSEKIPGTQIDAFFQSQTFPDSKFEIPDARGRKVWFRKIYHNCRVTLFEGGHELLPEIALNWLAVQVKGQETPIWNPPEFIKLKTGPKTTESGK